VPEQTLRLLLGEESHAGSIGPAILFGLLRFIGYSVFSLVFALWWGQSSLLYMPTFVGRHTDMEREAARCHTRTLLEWLLPVGSFHFLIFPSAVPPPSLSFS
jgi:hypothetical protein